MGSALALVIIVLDSGSTDATVEIAQRLGTRVYDFQWTDDFAAACNAALGFSRSDWNLVLDADEWIISGQDELLGLNCALSASVLSDAYRHDLVIR